MMLNNQIMISVSLHFSSSTILGKMFTTRPVDFAHVIVKMYREKILRLLKYLIMKLRYNYKPTQKINMRCLH